MTHAHVKLLTPSAQMPTRGSDLAAGLDVRADLLDAEGQPRQVKVRRQFTRDVVKIQLPEASEFGFRLSPGERALVPTGISMTTSADIYTRIAPRSGLAWNNGIDIFAGVVDADYSGEVGVLIFNSDPTESFVVTHGMRIAQLVLTPVSLCVPTQVTSHEATNRGVDGFGSTGTA